MKAVDSRINNVNKSVRMSHILEKTFSENGEKNKDETREEKDDKLEKWLYSLIILSIPKEKKIKQLKQ